MKSLVVAKYTFSEFLQSKILYNVFFLSIGLFILTYVASEFTYGVPQKVALDFGVGATSISTVLISIFLGANLILKEIENRTLYMVLSRPIDRSSFILGKLIGLMGIIFLNTIILGSISCALYFFLGGELNYLIPWVFIFIFIEALIVLLVVICFSLVTNVVLAVVNTIVVYIASYAIYEASSLSYVVSREGLNSFLKVFSFILPSLSKFNLKDFVLYEHSLSSGFIGWGLLYGVCYILFLFFVCTTIFSNKNLD
ncbi:hypothetical protein A9Q84_21385 [Halobacteriovorax marinus]|uniref:ABC transporter permease n=1 Tax=Halobacteriovorax marinus TaxID=97084 RepID=A0A1Y5F1N2_9BACT|nr:hypothetical protein A9Q84_21385 [Halobacteriovorax marinus]